MMKIHYIDPDELEASIAHAKELELVEPFRIEPPLRLHPERVAAMAQVAARRRAQRMNHIVLWVAALGAAVLVAMWAV